MRKILILFLLTGVLYGVVQAQVVQQTIVERHLEFRKLLGLLEETLPEVPMSIRRVTFTELGSPQGAFDADEIDYMKSQIERVINEYGSLTIITIPELDRRPVLEITGTDTSITISNRSPGGLKTDDPEAVLEIMQTYRVQGEITGTIRYSPQLGYSLTLRITRPESREVVWNKTIETRDFRPVGEPASTKQILLSLGAGANAIDNYDTGNAILGNNLVLVQFGTSVAIRQPFNRRNTGYVGLQGGAFYFNMLSTSDVPDYEEFVNLVPFGGLLLQKSLYEKSEVQHDYWIELFLSANVMFSGESQAIFYLNQGAIFNLSETIAIGVDLNLLLNSNNRLVDDDKTVTLSTLGYGIRAIFRL